MKIDRPFIVYLALGSIMVVTLLWISNRGGIRSEKNEVNPEEFEPISEVLVQKILDLPEVQWVYHPELKNRLPVTLRESKYVDKQFKLYKFGQKVKIMSPQELAREGIVDYLSIDSIKLTSDTLKFYLSYESEGAYGDGIFIKKDYEWKISTHKVLEF